jgi:hypothetical protein
MVPRGFNRRALEAPREVPVQTATFSEDAVPLPASLVDDASFPGVALPGAAVTFTNGIGIAGPPPDSAPLKPNVKPQQETPVQIGEPRAVPAKLCWIEAPIALISRRPTTESYRFRRTPDKQKKGAKTG